MPPFLSSSLSMTFHNFQHLLSGYFKAEQAIHFQFIVLIEWPNLQKGPLWNQKIINCNKLYAFQGTA